MKIPFPNEYSHMDWNDLRYFPGVARSGSLTQAAGEMAERASRR
ncbi:hypothetical protein BOSP111201_04640 [Bordetella sputigena]